jgi:nitric oxide reductase NorQ protein
VLIAAGQLMAEGVSPRDAARAAIAGPLTDDSAVTRGLVEMLELYLADAPAGDGDKRRKGGD